MRRDVRDFVSNLRRRGWHVDESRRRHVMVLAPDGGVSLPIPRMPSDRRWKQNAAASVEKVERAADPTALPSAHMGGSDA
jgi:hypothetical protein